MMTRGFPVLCGGTFFTLILEAAKSGLKERKRSYGPRGFTESDVFEALVQVAVPAYKKPEDAENYKSVVSAYKSCNTKKTGQLPIGEQANISSFDRSVKNEYRTPLTAINSLAEKYIDVDGKGDWLIRALLELAKMDIGANPTTPLYVRQDGKTIVKSVLYSASDICLSSLLLGLWHYIVVNRVDNGLGKDTYDKWCRPGELANTREPFKSDIGDGITQPIRLIPFKTTEVIVEKPSAGTEDEPPIEDDETYEEYEAPNAATHTSTQIINSPTVFQNSGDNCIQIDNKGTLNIGKDGKI